MKESLFFLGAVNEEGLMALSKVRNNVTVSAKQYTLFAFVQEKHEKGCYEIVYSYETKTGQKMLLIFSNMIDEKKFVQYEIPMEFLDQTEKFVNFYNKHIDYDYYIVKRINEDYKFVCVVDEKMPNLTCSIYGLITYVRTNEPKFFSVFVKDILGV